MKTVCIYHSLDLDGWMSAAIVKHWWIRVQNSSFIQGITNKNYYTNPNTGEDNIEFIGYNYGQPIPDLSEYYKVIMCDISFPNEIMEEIELNCATDEFIWIDHHKSAIESVNTDIIINIKDDDIRHINGLRDTKYAACELTWKYFFPNEPMPEIVRLLVIS